MMKKKKSFKSVKVNISSGQFHGKYSNIQFLITEGAQAVGIYKCGVENIIDFEYYKF